MSFSSYKITKNKYLFGISIFIIWCLLMAIILYTRGYKLTQHLEYTEQEIKEIAAELTMQCMLANPSVFIQNHNGGNQLEGFFVPAYVIPYRNIEHYFSENPNCCEIEGDTISVQGKIFYRTPTGEIHYGNMNKIYFYIPSFKSINPC